MRPLRMLLLVLFALVACERPRTRAPETHPPRAAPAAVDAGARSLWPTRITPLDAPTAERDACLARQRAALTTGVAEALSDLHYDRFFEDVCAAERALAERKTELCREIISSPVRAGCEMRVAVLEGDPELCPRSGSGRDPLCLAFTTGERAYCETTLTRDQQRCRATLANDADLCARASDAELCEATIARFASVVAPRARGRARTSTSSLRGVRQDAPGAIEIPLPAVLEHGVYIGAEGCEHVLVIDDTTARFGRDPRLLRLKLPFPAEPTLPLRVGPEHLELRMRTGGRLLDDTLGASGAITITRFSPTRLGAFVLTFDVTLRDGDERWRFQGEVSTFVRDLDPPRCGTP